MFQDNYQSSVEQLLNFDWFDQVPSEQIDLLTNLSEYNIPYSSLNPWKLSSSSNEDLQNQVDPISDLFNIDAKYSIELNMDPALIEEEKKEISEGSSRTGFAERKRGWPKKQKQFLKDRKVGLEKVKMIVYSILAKLSLKDKARTDLDRTKY